MKFTIDQLGVSCQHSHLIIFIFFLSVLSECVHGMNPSRDVHGMLDSQLYFHKIRTFVYMHIYDLFYISYK